MDAQELPEALIAQKKTARTAHSRCPCVAQRLPALCHPSCSLEVIDLLLSVPHAVDGEETDLLLDLRFLFRNRENAEAALRSFCDLRRRLEHRHYLVFYRLRRWCERHIVAQITWGGAQRIEIPVRIDFFCVEAIRRASLCAAMAGIPASERPALSFHFTPLQAEEPCSPA